MTPTRRNLDACSTVVLARAARGRRLEAELRELLDRERLRRGELERARDDADGVAAALSIERRRQQERLSGREAIGVDQLLGLRARRDRLAQDVADAADRLSVSTAASEAAAQACRAQRASIARNDAQAAEMAGLLDRVRAGLARMADDAVEEEAAEAMATRAFVRRRRRGSAP